MSLRVGVARTDITPSVGTPLAGYFEQRISQGVKDKLFAKALLLDDGSTLLSIVSCDLLHLNRHVVQTARALAEEQLDIPPENVLLCATHTHTGPPIDDVFEDGDAHWEDHLARSIAATIRDAKGHMREARLKLGVGEEESWVFNRRFKMRDGTVATIPWRDSRNIVAPAGPVDPEVGVLGFEDLNGHLFGVLVNYATHCDSMGGNLLSADYPGALAETIRTAKGSEVTTLFTAGAQGNISHIDANAKGATKGHDVTHRIGTALAEEVLQILERAEYTDCRLKAMSRTVELPLRTYSDEEISAAKKVLAKRWRVSRFQKIYAQRLLAINEMKEKTVEAELQAMALNDTVLAGIPGELFAELGIVIKQNSSFKHTFIIGLANAELPGYLVPSDAYDDQPSKRGLHNYEAQTTALAQGSAEKIVDACLRIVSALRE